MRYTYYNIQKTNLPIVARLLVHIYKMAKVTNIRVKKDKPGISEGSGPGDTRLYENRIIKEVYKKYNDSLQRYLSRRLDSQQDVDDVSQEVYLRLIKHRNIEKLTITLQLLCTIATNIIKDRIRRQKVRLANSHVSLTDIDVKSSASTPEEIMRSQEYVQTFKSVYISLNKNSRRAFSLHRFKGCTYAEIAKKMGISKSMVQKHISNVLFQMGKKFERLEN